MKKLTICVVTFAFALAACSKSESALSPAAIEVADRYCAQDFKPYFDIRDGCKAEVMQGKRGSKCTTSDQVDSIVTARSKGSGFKACPFPEVRWGVGENK